MKSKYIIGIDLGATNIKIGLVDSKGRITIRRILSTNSFAGREKILNALIKNIYNILQIKKLKPKDILGIGIGLPGPIDFKKGRVHYLPNISGWKDFPIKKWIAAKTRMPVFVDNDVNLVTLAEHRKGAGVGSDNMICITLGTGVGGGIIIDGHLYRGSSFAAGEVGHMPIVKDGPVCNCGGRGCLERFVGNRYILKMAKSRFKNNKITLEKLAELARKGNSKAIKIWQDVGEFIGVGLTGVVNLLNPKKIVVGGGVSGAGKVLFDAIRKTISSRAMPTQAKTVKVVKAKFAAEAGIIGAAILVKENV